MSVEKDYTVPYKATQKTSEYLTANKTISSPLAAKTIQRWFRAKKEYWNFRKVLYSAIKIQAAWRGKHQRNTYEATKKKIIFIQKWYKMMLYKDQIAERDFGLQVFYQYLKIKIEDAFLEKCFRLAITAQKLWRAYKVRKLLKGKRLIDHIFNKKVFRPCWNQIMLKSKIQAVIMIQRLFRGYICRKKSTSDITHTLQTNKLTRMSGKIQKWYRGEIVRKKISKIRSAVIKIQNFYRSKKQRKYFSRLCGAVLKIQKAVRAYYIKSKLIKSRLEDFINKEAALKKNLVILEQSELFLYNGSSADLPIQEVLKTLSVIGESSASSQLLQSSSLAIQSRQVSPFHLEKIYFFSRPLDIDLILDDSVVYEPLWSKQFEGLNKEIISREEQIMDVSVGNCHTLVVTSRGRLFAWGWNDKHQCGTAGTKPRLVEGAKEHKIVQISCGDDHSLALGSNGEVLAFGDNTKGQLGQGTYTEIKTVVTLDMPPTKQVIAVGNQNMAVTSNGELYLWPFETIHGEKRSYPMKMLYDYSINEVSVGYNFAMILATSGILFSLGINNTSGQLGHGDYSPRIAPTMILLLKKNGEKVSNVSCGYHHVLIKTTLGKVYTWGNGMDGQLGHTSLQNETLPRQVYLKNERLKPVQISGGYKHSILMLENRRILWTGSNSMIKSSVFVEASIGSRLPELYKNPGEYSVVKVTSVWSRVLSLINITVADSRYLQNNSNKIQAAINSLAAKWTSKHIEPPIIESISGYYPTSLFKKSTNKPITQKNNKNKHPLEEMKDKISEILKKPSDKWTLEERYTMEHISKLNH